MLCRSDSGSHHTATFMSLLLKKRLKSEINLALRAFLRNISDVNTFFSKTVPSFISRLNARHLEQFLLFQKL
jgi:hypothetical protein